jgi:hypothetical protein
MYPLYLPQASLQHQQASYPVYAELKGPKVDSIA